MVMADEDFDPYWAWGVAEQQPRLLHTMIRVRDVDASLNFYCKGLGMELLDRHDFAGARFSILFLSFGDYRDGRAALELTWNWDQAEDYSHGTGYGHVAIGVPDVDASYARLVQHGGQATSPPRAMIEGAPKLAFVKDPDGYAVELIQIRR